MHVPSSGCSCWTSEARASQAPSPHQACYGEGTQQRRQSTCHISGVLSASGSLPRSACLETSTGACGLSCHHLSTSVCYPSSIGLEFEVTTPLQCHTAPRAQAADLNRPLQTLQSACERLSSRRADNIIRDAEVVRKAMCHDCGGTGLWTLLGQSFGGFCAVRSLQPVLSMSPRVCSLCWLAWPADKPSACQTPVCNAGQADRREISPLIKCSTSAYLSAADNRSCLMHGRLTGALPECFPYQPG